MTINGIEITSDIVSENDINELVLSIIGDIKDYDETIKLLFEHDIEPFGWWYSRDDNTKKIKTMNLSMDATTAELFGII
jgi:hypothetical protein